MRGLGTISACFFTSSRFRSGALCARLCIWKDYSCNNEAFFRTKRQDGSSYSYRSGDQQSNSKVLAPATPVFVEYLVSYIDYPTRICHLVQCSRATQPDDQAFNHHTTRCNEQRSRCHFPDPQRRLLPFRRPRHFTSRAGRFSESRRGAKGERRSDARSIRGHLRFTRALRLRHEKETASVAFTSYRLVHALRSKRTGVRLLSDSLRSDTPKGRLAGEATSLVGTSANDLSRVPRAGTRRSSECDDADGRRQAGRRRRHGHRGQRHGRAERHGLHLLLGTRLRGGEPRRRSSV